MDPLASKPSWGFDNPLDIWIISRLHQLIEAVDRDMQAYDIPNALKPMLPFLDDASNWYVRRSRRRFWKSGDSSDKHNAYWTLHYVLVQLSRVLAPFTPFLAEELFLKLTDGQLGESVHLLDWPVVGHIDELAIDKMAQLREVIVVGLAMRAEAGIKVRQPLNQLVISAHFNFNDELTEILREEVNVKMVVFEGDATVLDTKLTPELKREGLMRDVVRLVQSARKQAGLQVDDRIALDLQTDDAELKKAIHEHTDTIKAETLALHLTSSEKHAFSSDQKVEGKVLMVSLKKA
jgi:isoleucyl-tRNA synthetase